MDADVLLVGSVPLSDAEEVLRMCGARLGSAVAGIPDGETGDRTHWVIYQAYRVFHEHPQLDTIMRPSPIDGQEQWIPAGMGDLWQFAIKPDVEDLRFDDLKYASVATASYEIFCRLRDEGAIAPGVRFQVCLPLPESGAAWFFPDRSDRERVLAAYEAGLIRELERLTAAIPAEDLSVQWDAVREVLDQEGAVGPADPDLPEPIDRFRDRVSRLAPHVPEDALLGYHLCYGDLGNRHIVEPRDLGVVVAMANIAVAAAGRQVDYFHMPVPADRSDDAYFEPLSGLDIADAKVFLGLIHTDGVEATRRRMTAAQRHIARFGIATECGFGRRPAEQVPSLLDIHKALADDLAGV